MIPCQPEPHRQKFAGGQPGWAGGTNYETKQKTYRLLKNRMLDPGPSDHRGFAGAGRPGHLYLHHRKAAGAGHRTSHRPAALLQRDHCEGSFYKKK